MMCARWFIVAALMACQSTQKSNFLPLMESHEIHEEWVAGRIQLADLKVHGPYQPRYLGSRHFPIGLNNSITSEVILSGHGQKAPLAILQHGNQASAREHFLQGMHLASWGFHVLVTTQAPEHQWLENGRRLSRFVELLFNNPQLINEQFHPHKIILIGHSFGGSAVSIASERLPHKVRGTILLDPAVYAPAVKNILPRIRQRSILIGADPKRFISKKRSTFSRHVPQLIEWTILGSTHNDAQFPTQRQSSWGFDWTIDEAKQKTFLASMTLAVLHLSYDFTTQDLTKRLKQDVGFLSEARLH